MVFVRFESSDTAQMPTRSALLVSKERTGDMKWALSAALGLLGLAAAAPAQGAYVIDFREVGGNVAAIGSGSLDLTDLRGPFRDPFLGPIITRGVGPTSAILGLPPSGTADFYSGSTTFVPGWGTGPFSPFAAADAGSGNVVGIRFYARNFAFQEIIVPLGYVSGTALGRSTATWTGASFASLELVPGSYVTDWGSDSFTVNIAQASNPVPEPAGWLMLLTGLGTIGSMVRLSRKTKVVVSYA
jgi:hypothetical protein